MHSYEQIITVGVIMGLLEISVIFYAALHSGKKCEDVFVQTAQYAVPSIAATDHGELVELARAACETTNPDIIWQIAFQESSFRFDIVRDNSGEKARILNGKAAKTFLTTLKKGKQRVNVDIGVMQINWAWHKGEFDDNPFKMLKAKEQVRYLVDAFADSLAARCATRWVGCYHNAAQKDLSRQYMARVGKKGRVLQLMAMYYIKNVRDSLSPQENALLPRVNKDQFYQAVAMSQGMPVPEKSPRPSPVQRLGFELPEIQKEPERQTIEKTFIDLKPRPFTLKLCILENHVARPFA